MTGNECGGRGWPQAGRGDGLAQEDALSWLVRGDGFERVEMTQHSSGGGQSTVEVSMLR